MIVSQEIVPEDSRRNIMIEHEIQLFISPALRVRANCFFVFQHGPS